MRIIKISDDIYEQLIQISKELNSQNNRSTAMPYFFQIQTNERIAVPYGCGNEAWNNDGSLIESDEEIKEAIYNYKDWDKENDSDYELLNDYEREEILTDAGWSKVNYNYEHKYQNAFFTEKACKEHIKLNHYHYHEPVDYLSHAFRNPEMELIMKFLCELTDGKLYK